MKPFLAQLVLLFLLVVTAIAQGPPPISTSQVSWPLFTAMPSVTVANRVIVGNPGPQTEYYWFVAHYTLGTLSPFGPFVALGVPNTLSGSNYVSVTPVYPVGGADNVFLNIDMLRTNTPTPPTGACNCAVALGVSSGRILDQSNSLLSYTVAGGIVAPNFTATIDNEVVGLGLSHLIYRQNGLFVADLTTIGGGGGIGGSGTVNTFPLWLGASMQGNSSLTVVTSPSGVNYSLGGGQFFQLDASHLSFNSGVVGSSNVIIANTFNPGATNNAGGIVIQGAPTSGSACAGSVFLQGGQVSSGSGNAVISVAGGCQNGFGQIGEGINLTVGLGTGGNGQLGITLNDRIATFIQQNGVGTESGMLRAQGGLTISPITGLIQCLHVSATGVVSGTGADCGASGGTLTGTGTANTLPMWTGASSLGDSPLSVASGTVSVADNVSVAGNVSANQFTGIGALQIKSGIPGANFTPLATFSQIAIQSDGGLYFSNNGGALGQVPFLGGQVAANQLPIGSGPGTFTTSTIPNCTVSTCALGYNNATQTFIAQTVGTGGASPLTANGDLYTFTGGVNARLPIGGPGQFLFIGSGLPQWNTCLSDSGSVLGYTCGGFIGLSYTTTGSNAGALNLGQGPAASLPPNSVQFTAPAAVITSHALMLPAAGASGYLKSAFAGTTDTLSFVAAIPHGDILNGVFSDVANTLLPGGTLDMGAATSANAFRLPVQAGCTAGANGVECYDPTSQSTKIRTANADSMANATAGALPANTILKRADAVTGLMIPSSCLDSGTLFSCTSEFKPPASTITNAGINLGVGVAPTAPNNADVWITSAGMFAEIAGTTVGPFGAGGSGSPPVPIAHAGAYTIVASDRGDFLYFTGSSAATWVLPQAGSSGFAANFSVLIRNSGTAILTVTPTTSTLNGVASVNVQPNGGLEIYSDNTNYFAQTVPLNFGGTNTQTTSYTVTELDKNKLVIMNCSAPCTVSLPAISPSPTWFSTFISIGSSQATLSLNGRNYNGGVLVPALVRYRELPVYTDGTNYFGQAPLVAGVNVVFTPASNGVTINAGGSAIRNLNPTLSANFNAGSAFTLVTPTVASIYRVCWTENIITAATTSSTAPSGTIGYTDVGGVARALTAWATNSANTAATVVSEGCSGLIYTNTSTAVTFTSTGYASTGATPMAYALAVTLEQL